MMIQHKTYSTIGCCGIDCGLCPMFHTDGTSVCPGCCGRDFGKKHPSCGVVTCCVINNSFETCADCSDFPCRKFDTDGARRDSFVTHKRMLSNLNFIRNSGIEEFIKLQQIRMEILTDFLKYCNDGRSKNFYCISCALLPVDKLQESRRYMISLEDTSDIKEKSKRLKNYIREIANDLRIELKLNRK